jgi:hypothetical protein
MLHSGLHFHPYKLHVVRELSDGDFVSRSAFCEQFITLENELSVIIRHFIMSDEPHFELPGCVEKKKNMQYWSETNPNELHVKPLRIQRVTV